jgi:hypothetical protein
MAMLARSLLVTAPKQKNYRGVLVYNCLGIVWFVWMVSFWVSAHLLVMLGIEQPVWVSFCIPLFPLVCGACALGLFDDWVGDNESKGFRGHFKALGKFVLTTGGLKMFGIGALCLFTSVSLYWDGIAALPRVILATCTIALMANFMNLFDLRPGRCSKVYIIVFAFSLLAVAFGGILKLDALNIACLGLAGIGPLLAVGRFDFGEKGMLGDAGANSMGVFVGYIFATALPLWALAILTLALFALNIASELVSFTKIIEANRFLSFLDNLGRKS